MSDLTPSPIPPSIVKKRLKEISDLFQLQKKFEKFQKVGTIHRAEESTEHPYTRKRTP